MPPNYLNFHKSITNELYSLKDRIRNLVLHWPTDGEWKEVALRNLLRKHLPSSVVVGSGFIVTEDDSSTQIDILVLDANKPTLFRDGDLYIVTPDCVLAAVEVKSRQASTKEFADTLTKLANVEKICSRDEARKPVWTGLFTFNDDEVTPSLILQALATSKTETGRIINCVAAGKNLFIRFWENGRSVNSPATGEVWHAYKLNETAPSYFIGNLIDSISAVDHRRASFAWFPELGGKEGHCTHYLEPADGVVKPYDL